ncbi:MAG: DUF2135 domain-containing protein [Acidobacteria bacterium]|nr:DUF2135 domain-containing protein [Acidobacteriota bacterium]
MVKKLFLLSSLVLWFTGALVAQDGEPVLLVKVKEAPEPLSVTQLKVEVLVYGFLAETRMMITFYNPHGRVLEGDLQFPLPEGAFVSGYALDVNGVMVDGVAVDREKGRVTFEKEVRKGVDPGLMEWTKGNNFRTRVYPIPAKGTRTVMVRYLSETVTAGGRTTYLLPLKHKAPVKAFSLRVEVVKPAAEPRIVKGRLGSLQFAPWRESFVAEASLENAVPAEDLEIELPKAQTKRVQVQKGSDGHTWFCVSDVPPVPKASEGAPRHPKRVGVFWDASGSREGAHERELGLLKAFFAAHAEAPVTVDLVFFRNEAEEARTFTVEKGAADALLAARREAVYDGGTRTSALAPFPESRRPDFYLLFTDGLSNFGKAEPPAFDAPVYALTEDVRADHPFLRQLALKTGGDYFNLKQVTDAEALRGIGSETFGFLRAEVSGGGVAEPYPQAVTPVHGRFTLVGRLSTPSATVTLCFGAGGRVTHRETVEVSAADAADGDLLMTFWAQRKVAELTVAAKKNARLIAETGKRYGLVTPETSLIVLERLEQYVEHGIAPPKSLPAMRTEFERLVEQKRQAGEREREEKVNHIVALWKARVTWWETEFKVPANFRFTDAERADDGTPEPSASRSEAAMAMPSVAPPAPAPREAEERVVVASADATAGMGAFDKKDKEKAAGPAGPAIAVAPWDPDTPYLKVLKAAKPEAAYTAYLAERKKHRQSPAFFLDCAEFFFRAKQAGLAVRVLSNVAELELENAALLRVMAHRLAQADLLEDAADTFEEVLRIRPEEPQSWRDLGLVLGRLKRYPRAMELLNHVVMNRWDRFDEIEVITLMELNAMIPKAKAAGVDAIPLDGRLVKLLDVDVRIVLTWDADLTDMDLWVTEPSGEKAMYSNNRTRIGGLVSRDFTQGYGPEEYCLHKAMHGTYVIEANYYGNRAQTLQGAVTLQVDVYTDYGRPTEKRKSLTLRLEQAKETLKVGQIEF